MTADGSRAVFFVSLDLGCFTVRFTIQDNRTDCGKNIENTVNILTKFSYLIRKALSKKIDMKFLPRVSFVGDKSFDYAEKIEKLIQKNK